MIIVITMAIYLPMLGLGFKGCAIFYTQTRYSYYVGCGSVYHMGQPYFELVIAMLCTGLDIATLIKFRKLATNELVQPYRFCSIIIT
uniref:Uncharacterized protein n=1 Tax=Acrobeloides nanus TaxID=290746 RepID=A0A914DRS8_9BILA